MNPLLMDMWVSVDSSRLDSGTVKGTFKAKSQFMSRIVAIESIPKVDLLRQSTCTIRR